MFFHAGDGVLEERLLDFLSSPADPEWEPGQLLVLRACNKSWQDKAGPLLLSGCSNRLASEDAQVRAVAVSALAASTSSRPEEEDRESADAAMAAALKSLEDLSVDVRRVALRTLAHVAAPGNAAAVQSAARLLTDRAWPVRWAAIDAVAWLAQGGSPSTVRVAVEVLAVRLEDVDWPVRMAAAIGLNNLLQFLAAISDEIKSDGPDSKLQVGKIDDVLDQMELLLDPLLKMLQDPAKEVKQAALDLLPLVCEAPFEGSTNSIPSLQRILEDVSLPEQLRNAAEGVVKMLRERQAVEETKAGSGLGGRSDCGCAYEICSDLLNRFSKAPREFAFDYVMDSSDATSGSFVSQERCYQLMAEKMVEHSLQGFSTCLFCYGQTGTGKTTTILGKPEPTSEQGLLLRLVTDLFQQVSILGEQVQCRVQIVEVHNERVRDLLTEGNDSQNPEVHVHPQLGVYLKHAVDQPVQSLDACLGIIEDASGRQTVASTAMNSQSSRGHTVYKLSVERHGGDNTVMTSEVFFVDLAGRENERTTRVSGERLVELSFINRSWCWDGQPGSLMWLSQCIYALGNTASGRRSKRLSRLNGEERRSGSFRLSSLRDSKELTRSSMISEDSDATPHRRGSKAENNTMARFRNSKLTLLLAKALSGNSKTSVICTLSPAKANAEESCTTLNFAASLKSVKVFATPATRIDKDSLISGLQSELQELRQQLSADNSVELSSQLEVANGMLEKYRASWQQKIKENQQLRQQCSSALQRLGLARSRIAGRSLTPDPYLALEGKKAREGRPSCPHLASYDDPERSGRMIFPVTDKSEFSLGSAPECHFVLPERHGIAPRCAYLWLEDDRLFIRASNGIPVPRVEVNHQRLAVDEVKELFHGDFLVFGSACCFFVCLDDLAVSDSHRVRKLPAWWALGMKERTKVMQEILDSDATSKELQVALHYMSVLQSQNLDSEGLRNLDKFLGSAKRAAELVSEGNALTGALKPLSKLKLELSSIAPVMLYGYGDNCGVPELCIRLVKDLRPKMPEVETLAFWTLAQFQVRLRIMRELHEKRLHSPDTFALDARADPWAEHAVPSSSRRMGASELRGDIHSEAAKVGVGTSSLAQERSEMTQILDDHSDHREGQ
ncbi:unnamed protein product [Cladocopium goreaui]|uniref:Kinesin-like protein KIF13B n=1 Tax=Cladocopium goreaui TaxID=2562237 RepID=A0A9P1BL45_9DINO|nr:unnamed protein product [Cladocopium goreaui]